MAPSVNSRRNMTVERLGGLRTRLSLGLRRFRWAAKTYGPAQAIARVPAALRRGREPDRDWLSFIHEQDGNFDLKYGVDTAGLVYLRDLKVVGQHWTAGVDYQAVGEELFRQMMWNLPIQPQDYTFVDLGCGKGRPLVIAAGYPFRAVIGVEYSEELAATAQNNVEVFKGPRLSGSVKVVHADAAEYELPDGPLVVFLYNPFGEVVMEQVIPRIEQAAHKGRIPSYVIYYNPRHRQLFRSDTFEAVEFVPVGNGYVVYRCPPMPQQDGVEQPPDLRK